MRDVAFCLVENEKGEVLFVQRAHGQEKGKWSLPGGLVDRGEGSRHAAYRETREENGCHRQDHPPVVHWQYPSHQGVRWSTGGRSATVLKEGMLGCPLA